MKVHEARIQLAPDGKPQLFFDVEPETDLEKDALKAMGYHHTAHWHDELKPVMSGSVEVKDTRDKEGGYWGLQIWTGWRESPQAYHKRRSGKGSE